ncbi:MAG: hypothetical protein RQ824_08615, partial [bacterium]|nr:hypothetical protein [bacterium]
LETLEETNWKHFRRFGGNDGGDYAAVEMWGKFDVEKILGADSMNRWRISKKTFFGGNYQVFTAGKTKKGRCRAALDI